MCSITPPSTPPRSVSPVEATLIDALPESPTAAVPVRSEATPEPVRPIRRSVALRLRYKECNGDLAGGSFVELAKTLADGLTFSDRVQFARVRHATVTIAFPPGLSTGQELTVALEV